MGLQRAVANHNNLEFAPNRVLSPDTEFASRNNTEFLSNNDPQVLSPNAGENVQQGGVNLDFSDMTFGDRNEASDGSVINTGNAGDIDATNVEGDGNVVGDDNENVNTGDIEDSNVNIGEDNEIDDSGDQTAGGDIISGNEGPVINDVDMSGGSGGGAVGGDGGGGLIGVGNDGGNATGGAGGGGGGIVINDNDTTNVDGNQTTVGDIDGNVSGGDLRWHQHRGQLGRQLGGQLGRQLRPGQLGGQLHRQLRPGQHRRRCQHQRRRRPVLTPQPNNAAGGDRNGPRQFARLPLIHGRRGTP